MTPPALFGISVGFGLVVWGVVAALYIWPWLRSRPHADALRPVLLLHAFRFAGLAFLVPGVVSPDLPAAFARPAAYGDLTAAILALFALATLRTKFGTVAVWAFNILGSVDLLYAFYQGNRVALVPGMQGATYFIPTVFVPLLLITHWLIFKLLFRRDDKA